MEILTQDQVLELRAAVISARLVDSRDALLTGIDSRLVASLPRSRIAGDQVLRDLDIFNTTGALGDGKVPLRIWLKNAVSLSEVRRDVAIFEAALVECNRILAVISGDGTPSAEADGADGREAPGTAPGRSNVTAGRDAVVLVANDIHVGAGSTVVLNGSVKGGSHG